MVRVDFPEKVMFKQRPKEVSEKAPRSKGRKGAERKFVQRPCGGHVSQQQTAGDQWLEQWTKRRDIYKARSDTEGEGSAGSLGLYSHYRVCKGVEFTVR